MIPLKDCRHGWTYRISSRNLAFGVFNSKTLGFVGIREKFGDLFLFEEYHQEAKAYNTVTPLEAIEECPIQDLRCHLEDRCRECNVETDFVMEKPEGRVGRWIHRGPTSCPGDARPHALQNEPLFRYLEGIRKREERG